MPFFSRCRAITSSCQRLESETNRAENPHTRTMRSSLNQTKWVRRRGGVHRATADERRATVEVVAEAARLAGIARRVTKGLPCVGITEHPADGGRTWCVAVNYAPEAVACPISVRGAVGRVFNGTFDGRCLSIKAGDAAVFEITGSDK